jgi:hypothetical protein
MKAKYIEFVLISVEFLISLMSRWLNGRLGLRQQLIRTENYHFVIHPSKLNWLLLKLNKDF